MIEQLFDKIESPYWRAFLYRVYNTFMAVIFPVMLPLIALELANNPNDISCLLEWSFWSKVVYSVVVALVGAAIAGLDKVRRLNKELMG